MSKHQSKLQMQHKDNIPLNESERTELDHLRQENAEQHRKLEQQAIDLKAMTGGAIGIYREEIARLLRERDNALTEAQLIHYLIPTEMRTRTITPPQVMVSTALILREGDDFYISHPLCNPDYPGTREDALVEIPFHFYFLLNRLPIMSEMRGGLDDLNINENHLVYLLQQLVKTRYRSNRETYLDQRRGLFKDLYRTLENDDYPYTWQEFSDRMAKIIERSFEQAEQYRERDKAIQLAQDFSRQILA